MSKLMRLYSAFRDPRNFLVILISFVVASAAFHMLNSYDPDWGTTNLILSIEASIASAAIMMMSRNNSDEQAKMLDAVYEMSAAQDKTLRGVLLIAEAQRDMLISHTDLLHALKEGDERILKELTESEKKDGQL
jgi:hypothetical protein